MNCSPLGVVTIGTEGPSTSQCAKERSCNFTQQPLLGRQETEDREWRFVMWRGLRCKAVKVRIFALLLVVYRLPANHSARLTVCLLVCEGNRA